MPTFEIASTTMNITTPDIFGLWQTTPAPQPIGVSFSAGESPPEPDIPTWRVKLPSHPTSASTVLAEGETRMHQTRELLPSIQQYIADLVAQADAIGPGQVAFSTTTDPYEHDMLMALQQIKGTAPQSVSFSAGTDETTIKGWEDTNTVHAIVGHIHQAIASYLRVETEIEGIVQARTTVAWKGHIQTILTPGISPDTTQLHARSTTLALTSRDTFLQIVQQTVQVLLMVTTPAGAIMALPAAWTLINRILKLKQGDKPYGK